MIATLMQTSDAKLVTAARSGDRQAFARLVDRYFGTIWAIAYARLGNRAVADDLAQEVFLVAMLHLDSLTDPSLFAPWAGQIARNRAIDWLRHEQRSSKLVAMVPVEELANTRADVQESPMEREEEAQAVRNAVFALPEEQREIVLLKYVEGLNQTEIAQRLQVHPATIGRQLEKALAAMRDSMTSLLETSISQKMRASPHAALRATALVAAVAGMSASSKAAMLSAAGTAPKAAAAAVCAGTAGKAGVGIAVGAGIMGTAKMTGVVVGIVLLSLVTVGVVVYEQNPSQSRTPTTSVSVSQPDPFMATPEQLQAILAARYECFPPDVVALLRETATKALTLIDPEHKLDSQILTVGVDQQGQCWMAFLNTLTGDGTGRAKLENFNTPRIMGVVTEAGDVLPVQMSPNDNGSYAAVVQFKDPWPAGENRTLGLLTDIGPVHLNAQGSYDIQLNNIPWADKIQQIGVVTTPGWRLQSSINKPALSTASGSYQIHVWQKHLQKGEELNVNAKLERLTPP